MKKINLLLTTPIVALAPIVSCLAATSCGNSIKIDVGENEYVEYSYENLKMDEDCTITLKIKQDYIGAKFLPTSLDTILVGKELISQYDIYERDNYFVYIPNEAYSQAKVYIKNVTGDIKISPKLESLTGISVSMKDALEDVAYFDKGEKFNTDNISVFANISNEEVVPINDYQIECAWESGHEFTQDDVNKTNEAKITYTKGNAVFSATYKVTCVEKTVAKFNKNRYGSINDAIEAYNKLEAEGTYVLRIMPGTYVLDSALTIKQNYKDKNLIIMPDKLDNDVILQGKITQAGASGSEVIDSVFDINGCSGLYDGSITFSRLNFASPEIKSGVTPTEYNHFNVINCLQGDEEKKAHNIYMVGCAFNGNKGKLVTAFNTNSTAAKHIIIDGCTGTDINAFFDGTIEADSELEYDDYDLYISGCEGTNMLSLANIAGDDLTCRISNCTGGYMYAKSGELSLVDSIISINGYGKFEIALCELEQIAYGSSTEQNAFIKVSDDSDEANKQLIISSSFVKCDDEDENKINHLYNESTTGSPWAYSYGLNIGVLNNDSAIDLKLF